MFLRESEGIYQFGQKRVSLKIGKDGQVFARVGAGWIPVSDFVDKYTPQEVNKLERNDAVTKFRRKISIQRICMDHASHSLEKCPINEANSDTNTNSLQITFPKNSNDKI